MPIIYPSPLLGLAVGDALGIGFETRHMFDAALLSWDGTYQDSAFHGLKAGQTSDDTRASKLLAESLIARKGFDPEDIAKRYAQWYASGDHRGMGGNTSKALSRLASGIPWNTSGERWAEGNGTAMRAGVIGAFLRGHPKVAATVARDEAKITHDSSEAMEGSAAIAAATSLLVDGCPKDRLISLVLELLPSKTRVREGIEKVRSMVAKRQAIGDVLGFELQTGAHVVDTVPAAFAAFLLTASYSEAVYASVRAGGDTDTTAAIAGGLAGAHYGKASIPPKLLKDLEEVDVLTAIEGDLLQY